MRRGVPTARVVRRTPSAPFSSALATSPREAAFAGRLHAAIAVHFAQKRLSWEMRGGVPTARAVRRTPARAIFQRAGNIAPRSSLRGAFACGDRRSFCAKTLVLGDAWRRSHGARSAQNPRPRHLLARRFCGASVKSANGIAAGCAARIRIEAHTLRLRRTLRCLARGMPRPRRSRASAKQIGPAKQFSRGICLRRILHGHGKRPMWRAFLPAGTFAAIMRKARTGARRFRRGTAKAAGNRKSDFRQILAPCPRWDRRRKGTHPPCTGRR